MAAYKEYDTILRRRFRISKADSIGLHFGSGVVRFFAVMEDSNITAVFSVGDFF